MDENKMAKPQRQSNGGESRKRGEDRDEAWVEADAQREAALSPQMPRGGNPGSIG